MDELRKKKYIDKYFCKLYQINGVQNVLIFDSAGRPKRSTIEKSHSIYLIGLIQELILKAERAIRAINSADTFLSMRLRTKKFEILITKDSSDLNFVVFQNANGEIYRKELIFFFLQCPRQLQIIYCLSLLLSVF